jgi:hypothetical protein
MVVDERCRRAVRVDVFRLTGDAVEMERGDPGRGGAVDHLHTGIAGKSDGQQRQGKQR